MSTVLPDARVPIEPSARRRDISRELTRTSGSRRAVNHIMLTLTALATMVAMLPLLFILAHIVREGASSLSWSLFTAMPQPVGESGGGLANAIVGTLVLVATASALGVPVGIGAGLYLAEHRGARLADGIRFLCDVLNGLPSIVVGIFAWQFLVRPVGHFSALSGAAALATMMVPMVARTTEEMVRTVPVPLRESALALGYPRWRTSLAIVLRTAGAGVVTGALVALARVAGETAPLLFTALGNQFWSTSLREPIAALPLQIFTYAISPYDAWHTLAWAGALVLIAIVLAISIVARVATRARVVLADGS